MKIYQQTLQLEARSRGFHLITEEVLQALPQLQHLKVGQCQLFIKHSSASLALNENADPMVRHDMEAHFNEMVPENQPYYKHTLEGPDDMPAHIKAALLGSSVSIPVTEGHLALGTWQGIYLCEHRNNAGPRSLVITCWGTTIEG
ncbi:MAG: secondary thiamine-phosphate synthase enzyme YjbQ [Owenweeksia sp.]|nr:secondary thiamine-phosphate synthase enzyme YjbQ [Owenweeksia sp.]